MNFLVDQQLPRVLARWIESQGHQAVHVRDLGLEHADDRDLWREARARKAVIVSKDEDFSVIVRVRDGPQVIWVRLGNCANQKLIGRMAELWPSLVEELAGGALLVEIR